MIRKLFADLHKLVERRKGASVLSNKVLRIFREGIEILLHFRIVKKHFMTTPFYIG